MREDIGVFTAMHLLVCRNRLARRVLALTGRLTNNTKDWIRGYVHNSFCVHFHAKNTANPLQAFVRKNYSQMAGGRGLVFRQVGCGVHFILILLYKNGADAVKPKNITELSNGKP